MSFGSIIIIHSKHGEGKTQSVLQVPSMRMLDTEMGGRWFLHERGEDWQKEQKVEHVTVACWPQIVKELREFVDSPLKNICIDHFGDSLEMAAAHVLQVDYNNKFQRFDEFGKGNRGTKNILREVKNLSTRLVNANKNLWIMCHSTEVEVADKQVFLEPRYLGFEDYLRKADLVGYLHRDESSDAAWLELKRTSKWDAKIRFPNHGLPNRMAVPQEGGFRPLLDAIDIASSLPTSDAIAEAMKALPPERREKFRAHVGQLKGATKLAAERDFLIRVQLGTF